MSVDISSSGHYGVCCDADPVKVPVGRHTSSEWFAGERLGEVRELMLAGAMPLVCRTCYKKEARGGGSKRTFTWDHLKRGSYGSGEEIFAQPKMRMLSYRFGNQCNLACLMCESESSTAFNAESRILDGAEEKRIAHLLTADDQTLKDIQVLYLGGGEPSLSSECVALLDRLIAIGHTEIYVLVNSNGSNPSSAFFERLKSFRGVYIGFSIDGRDSTYDFLRYPMTWPRLQKNLNLFAKEYPHFEFGVIFTLHVLNAANLPGFLKWWLEFNGQHANRFKGFEINGLSNPDFMRLQLIPQVTRDRVVKELKSVAESAPEAHRSVVENAIREMENLEVVEDHVALRALKKYVQSRADHRELDASTMFEVWNDLYPPTPSKQFDYRPDL